MPSAQRDPAERARYEALLFAVRTQIERLETQLRWLRDDQRKAADHARKLRADR